MTGAHDIIENELLSSPIILTDTFGTGAAHQGVLEYGRDYAGI